MKEQKKLAEHSRVETLIQKRISNLQKGNTNRSQEEAKKDIERLRKIANLFSNINFRLMQRVNIDVALAMLQDIGVPEEELKDSYRKLLQEENGKMYTMIDIEGLERTIEKKKDDIGGEAR